MAGSSLVTHDAQVAGYAGRQVVVSDGRVSAMAPVCGNDQARPAAAFPDPSPA